MEETTYGEFHFCAENRKLFHQYDEFITTYCVPWIMGKGDRTPAEAKAYIKRGQVLDQKYYASIPARIDAHGMTKMIKDELATLFREYDVEYSRLIGKDVFQPSEHMFGIFNIMINEKLGLIARISGITLDGEYVVVDNRNYYRSDAEAEIVLQASMAVCGAKKGTYLSRCRRYDSAFNKESWENILAKIREWA